MKFSDHLWQQNRSIYQKIIAHPFIVELANGTLSLDRFNFYIKQDSHYLVEFSRALALIASRAQSTLTSQIFLQFSLGALIDERTLHAHFLGPESARQAIEPSFVCRAYTRYLVATTATASIEEAIAAVLPCFWIYREVGKYVAGQTKENNPYECWIKTYSDQEFSEGTEQAISILDEVASQASANALLLMETVFKHCADFEWHFWNDAYFYTNK